MALEYGYDRWLLDYLGASRSFCDCHQNETRHRKPPQNYQTDITTAMLNQAGNGQKTFTFVGYDINQRGISSTARAHLMKDRVRLKRESRSEWIFRNQFTPLPWTLSPKPTKENGQMVITEGSAPEHWHANKSGSDRPGAGNRGPCSRDIEEAAAVKQARTDASPPSHSAGLPTQDTGACDQIELPFGSQKGSHHAPPGSVVGPFQCNHTSPPHLSIDTTNLSVLLESRSVRACRGHQHPKNLRPTDGSPSPGTKGLSCSTDGLQNPSEFKLSLTDVLWDERTSTSWARDGALSLQRLVSSLELQGVGSLDLGSQAWGTASLPQDLEGTSMVSPDRDLLRYFMSHADSMLHFDQYPTIIDRHNPVLGLFLPFALSNPWCFETMVLLFSAYHHQTVIPSTDQDMSVAKSQYVAYQQNRVLATTRRRISALAHRVDSNDGDIVAFLFLALSEYLMGDRHTGVMHFSAWKEYCQMRRKFRVRPCGLECKIIVWWCVSMLVGADVPLDAIINPVMRERIKSDPAKLFRYLDQNNSG